MKWSIQKNKRIFTCHNKDGFWELLVKLPDMETTVICYEHDMEVGIGSEGLSVAGHLPIPWEILEALVEVRQMTKRC